MQHTKLDRWLCRKFVHINRIYFNTMPEGIPRDLEIVESGAESGARYKYRGTTRDANLAHEVSEIFVSQNITYTARVDELDTLLARFVGDPRRSVTMMFIWIGLFIFGIIFAFSGIPQVVISNILMDQDSVKAQDKINRAERLRKMDQRLN